MIKMSQDCNLTERGEESSPKPPLKKMEITYIKIICSVLAIGSYILDIGWDVFVAVRHYRNGDEAYFSLTVLFIVFPAVIITATSVWWYIKDNSKAQLRASPTQWIIRIIFLTLWMAPVLRNVEALYYAKKSTKSTREVEQQNYARRMIYENTDASFLRLFEACLECAPQLILQIYIIAQVHYNKPNDISTTEIIQLISIFTSLLSMTFAVLSYLRSLRESLDYKNELSCSITVFPFLWRFLDITARIVTLGLFASILLPYFFLLVGIHFGIMLVWIRFMNTDFCDKNKNAEWVYNLLLSFMFIFCFINPKDDKSQTRYIQYYCLIFVENTVLISIWYHHNVHFARLVVLIMVFVCFALAIIIMVLYYIYLHPTRGILFDKSSSSQSDVPVPRSQSIASRFTLSREFFDTIEGDGSMLETNQTVLLPSTGVEKIGEPAVVQNGKPTEMKCEYEKTEC